MMNRPSSSISSDGRIFRKLVESSLYQTYRKGYTDATGLEVALVPLDEDIEVSKGEVRNLNSFCREINDRGNSCESCVLAHRCLAKTATGNAETVTCAAGMRETAIPVRNGDRTIALLTTGQIFTGEPNEEAFAEFSSKLGKSKVELEKLHTLWDEGRVMTLAQYQGAVTVLAAFALQLSDLFNRLMLEETNSEPDIVIRAKQFVNARLENKIILEQVSRHVGVSQFYFCKVFKQSSGMTLTEYVNRRRVEWAKRRLLKPRSR